MADALFARSGSLVASGVVVLLNDEAACRGTYDARLGFGAFDSNCGSAVMPAAAAGRRGSVRACSASGLLLETERRLRMLRRKRFQALA